MWEAAWVWITRALAVIGFWWLLVTTGFNAPWGAYILLIGLFFGPDVLKSQLPTASIQKQKDRKDK
jgi:hypothetical protein